MIRVSNIRVAPEGTREDAFRAALSRLKLKPEAAHVYVARQSVDARNKADVHFVYTVDVAVRQGDEAALLKRLKPRDAQLIQDIPRLAFSPVRHRPRPVVAGLGPCGLFAALALAKAGLEPLVLERGLPVEQRGASVNRFFNQGQLDPDSNIQFGEGGAGTFSDGKLTSGIKDPLCREVLRSLHEHGAPEEVLYLARPHVGTDKLPRVVSSIRRQIEALGGQVLFSARLEAIQTEKEQLRGITYRHQGQLVEAACDRLVLALGHSARDTQQALYRQGLRMVPKPLSIGLRLEQLQSVIDRAQYGAFAGRGHLPPAEYHLSHRCRNGRGTYTFCMCPGGWVVNASSEAGHLCVNGMSPFRRDRENANAAILVDVRPEDFAGEEPLAGFHFQRHWEQRAFKLGGGDWHAPAQLARDFLADRPSRALEGVQPTVKPGVRLADLRECLPPFAVEALKEGLTAFDRKLQGFLSGGAVLTGVETRSSSPIRVPRAPDGQSNIQGVYAAGEGAGMAGGIMSAAVDGLKTAGRLMESLTKTT